MEPAESLFGEQHWRATMVHGGLDAPLKQKSICVVNDKRSVVREGVVDSDPEAIDAFVRSNAPDAVRVGLESGPTATWLRTELKRLGVPVICIAPGQGCPQGADQ
jgi:hypothetical protein